MDATLEDPKEHIFSFFIASKSVFLGWILGIHRICIYIPVYYSRFLGIAAAALSGLPGEYSGKAYRHLSRLHDGYFIIVCRLHEVILSCLFEKRRHIVRAEVHFSCVGEAVCYLILWSIRLYLDHEVQAWFSHTSLR